MGFVEGKYLTECQKRIVNVRRVSIVDLRRVSILFDINPSYIGFPSLMRARGVFPWNIGRAVDLLLVLFNAK